jgi:TrmH family RNA methyltransferase
MDIHLKRYKKDFDYSYTFGVFPTLELLSHTPENVITIIIHTKGLNNEGIFKIKEICTQKRIPLQIQGKKFQRIGARENDYAVGVFRKVKPGIKQSSNHVVLVNPGSMGNLGTIIRTMLGFDYYDLSIIQPSADIFHPDVVRASMGALFQLRFDLFDNFDNYKNAYPRTFYSFHTDANIYIQYVNFDQPMGLIFGNESSGLPHGFNLSTTRLKIQQSNNIDSLNLAVAVGITLYHSKFNKD